MNNLDKLIKFANRIESKLKKLAQMPDESNVKAVIVRTFDSLKSNPEFKGTLGIDPRVSVSGSIGDPVLVYFQVIVTEKDYPLLIQEPRKSALINSLSMAVLRELQAYFRNYDFKIKIGIVP